MTIVQQKISVPGSTSKLCFTLTDVFSEKECQELIALSESKEYDAALLNVGGGRQVYRPDVRNNDRCIIDDEELADKFWQKIKPYIPAEFKNCAAVGLNERLRFLRYDPGQSFAAHWDGVYERESGPKKGERSYITVQIYLNEGFTGGETTFFGRDEERIPVVPLTGSVLVFQHDMLHEGSALIKGRKYAIRTDVMFSRPFDAKKK
eukprot:TRINITY_DN4473_c0_g1_i1.p1 TRINITY_DN4473_c0_g1~~TRINITY_DN4473_c0_g1_i1.p1  ORF type:complete len:206 (-),score=46.21 TRINITY_DN4473_c0_g1_i1:99-716(-)